MSLTTQERNMLSTKVNTNVFTLSKMTEKQIAALVNLTENSTVSTVEISVQDFSLPNDWLSVVLCYRGGGTLYCGISPDGDVHS